MEERRIKTTLTVEESQRLIELGVDPKMASMVSWRQTEDWQRKSVLSNKEHLTLKPFEPMVMGFERFEVKDVFTLADLLSILPKEIIADTIMGEDFPCALTIRWDENRKVWHCAYECLPLPLTVGESPELIDALYQLTIWCLEKKIIKLKEE